MAQDDDLQKVKKILQKSTLVICDSLNPEDVLRYMEVNDALTSDDLEIIRGPTARVDRAEKLLNPLRVKPVSSYDTFMEILKQKRNDLFLKVQVIATELGYVKAAESPYVKPAPKPGNGGGGSGGDVVRDEKVSRQDIKDVVRELGPAELKKLYDELEIPDQDVRKAEANAGIQDVDEKAKSVLRMWKEENAGKATRKTILLALKECKLVNTMEKLQEKWNVKM